MTTDPQAPHPGAPIESRDIGRSLAIRSLMQIVWPAFLGAIIGIGILFSTIDPTSLEVVIVGLGGNRAAAYTVGFLLLWLVIALACALTWLLASTESRGRRSAQPR